MTALHYACDSDRDDVEILEVLLGKGCADVNALNKAGESPLRLAINRKGAFSATARYLRDSGGKDLGPKPRQTSPVQHTDSFPAHRLILTWPPPVRNEISARSSYQTCECLFMKKGDTDSEYPPPKKCAFCEDRPRCGERDSDSFDGIFRPFYYAEEESRMHTDRMHTDRMRTESERKRGRPVDVGGGVFLTERISP
jgi:ankyrin repeat protein